MPKRKPSEVDALVGKCLRNLRDARRESQTEIGRAIGITFQQVQKFERGENRISASQLFELAQHFDVPVDHFFAGVRRNISAKRGPVTPDPQSLAALEFAASKRGLNLLRAIASLKDEALRDCVIEFVQLLARKSEKR